MKKLQVNEEEIAKLVAATGRQSKKRNIYITRNYGVDDRGSVQSTCGPKNKLNVTRLAG
jgi:hypothetical protein